MWVSSKQTVFQQPTTHINMYNKSCMYPYVNCMFCKFPRINDSWFHCVHLTIMQVCLEYTDRLQQLECIRYDQVFVDICLMNQLCLTICILLPVIWITITISSVNTPVHNIPLDVLAPIFEAILHLLFYILMSNCALSFDNVSSNTRINNHRLHGYIIQYTLNGRPAWPVFGGFHGPLTRYVQFRVAFAPGMPGTFSPSPTSKETAS